MLAITPSYVQPTFVAAPIKMTKTLQQQRILRSKVNVIAKTKEIDVQSDSDAASTTSTISIQAPETIVEPARADICVTPSTRPSSPVPAVAAPVRTPSVATTTVEKKTFGRKLANKLYSLDWSMVELAAGQQPGKCINPSCAKCLKEAEYNAKVQAKLAAKATKTAAPKEKKQGRKLAKLFTIDWSLVELAAGQKPAGVCVNPNCSKCLAEKKWNEKRGIAL